MRRHCPPDTEFEIRALTVWGRAHYLLVTVVPHNISLTVPKKLSHWPHYMRSKLYKIFACYPVTLWTHRLYRPLGNKRVYLPLYKVADTSFQIQEDPLSPILTLKVNITSKIKLTYVLQSNILKIIRDANTCFPICDLLLSGFPLVQAVRGFSVHFWKKLLFSAQMISNMYSFDPDIAQSILTRLTPN